MTYLITSFIRFQILAFLPKYGGRPPKHVDGGLYCDVHTHTHTHIYIYIVTAIFWILPNACKLEKVKHVTKLTM
jgi:hypothetical protein